MSPNALGRARDNSRRETRQSKRAVEVRRNKQVAGVVLAMLVIIGGFVILAQVLNRGNKGAATGASAPNRSATPIAGCANPPTVPADLRTGTLPNKATAAGKTFLATVTTNCGVIEIELDGTKAPQTVASFVALAKRGYWDNSPCHRLTTSNPFVLQCGDPTGTGGGNPGYGFGVENAPADFAYRPASVAMARTPEPNSNGGQFFIVYKDTVLEDPVGYSIFGRVVLGMDVVDQIVKTGATKPDARKNTAPVQPISILRVHVAEKKALK